MQLSIIVPVYNMADGNKLNFCLDSLVNQTVEDYEIIAVDDASTDDSLNILRDYEKAYPEKVRVIALPENLVQGGAKNRALDVCRGDYIGFVDSDDWIMPDMYEKMLKKASETGADIVACDLCMTDRQEFRADKTVKGIPKEAAGDMTKERFGQFILDTGHMVIKLYARHIFQQPKLRFPEHMFYEDNAIALETLHRAGKTAYVEEPLYFYYQHGSSTVHKISTKRCEDRMEAMRLMLKLAEEGGYLEPFRTQIEYKFTNLFYQNTLFSYMQGAQRKNLRFLARMGKEMKETFPDFEQNPIYLERVNPEERKLMHLQLKSSLLFVMYYKALRTYRRIRYGKA